MQINLKQAEIVSALKAYIAAKGIDLTSKTVEIDFTAGRKNTGLSADITIEDFVVPMSAFEEPAKPALTVVKVVLTAEPYPASVQEETPEVAPTPGAKSLFG
jgi:hypothetical protein